MSVAQLQASVPTPDWGVAPHVGGPDPHLESAGRGLAHMGTIGAQTLSEIFEKQLKVLGDPSSSAEARAQAEQILRGGLKINETLANAQENFAQARELQTQLHAQPAESFSQAGRADEIAQQMAEHFSQAREGMVKAGEGLSKHPTLQAVLNRAGETMDGFSAGVARTGVTLQSLASRALALPGMVRDRLVDKSIQVEQAIGSALSDFHAATAKRVNALREEAAGVAAAAWSNAAQLATRAKEGAEAKANEIKQAGVEVVEGMRLTAQDFTQETRQAAEDTMDTVRLGAEHIAHTTRSKAQSVKSGAQEAYESVREGVVYGANVVKAVDQTVETQLVGPVRQWFTQKALPAIKGFAQEFSQEFHARLDEGMNASLAERRKARSPRIEPTMGSVNEPSVNRASLG